MTLIDGYQFFFVVIYQFILLSTGRLLLPCSHSSPPSPRLNFPAISRKSLLDLAIKVSILYSSVGRRDVGTNPCGLTSSLPVHHLRHPHDRPHPHPRPRNTIPPLRRRTPPQSPLRPSPPPIIPTLLPTLRHLRIDGGIRKIPRAAAEAEVAAAAAAKAIAAAT